MGRTDANWNGRHQLLLSFVSGGWLGVVCGLDDPTVGLLRPWVATRDGDGWQLEQT